MRKDNEIEVESKSINDNLKNTRPSSILNLRCFFMRGKKRKLKKKSGKNPLFGLKYITKKERNYFFIWIISSFSIKISNIYY